jgi:glycosyltransferase involved in cell wall biosynthesis
MALDENMGDLVSIVIPAYNAEIFIENTIQSIYDQTYRPIEIICVNDSSTDATEDVVNRKFSSHPSGIMVRLVNLPKNGGTSNALNVGFSSSKGRFICWLSADDLFISQEKLEIQVSAMKRDGSSWSFFWENYSGEQVWNIKKIGFNREKPQDIIANFIFGRILRTIIQDPQALAAYLMLGNPVNGSSIMITRSTFDRYGRFDPALRNIDPDGDILLRYSSLELKVSIIKGIKGVFYTQHSKQTSKKTHEMYVGCELTRIRALNALATSHKLTGIIKKYELFLPYLLLRDRFSKFPITAELLSLYVLENKEKFDWFLVFMMKKVLKRAKSKIRSNGINIKDVSFMLSKIKKSPVYTDFVKLLDAQ